MRSSETKKAVAGKAATKKKAPTKKNAVPQPVKKVAAKGKTITKEIAQRYLKDSSSVDLSPFTDLDDEAAEVLGKSKGDLKLGVVMLSDASAKHFASFVEVLRLPKLRTLSDAAAKSLETLDYEGRLEVSERFCKTMSYLANLCPEWTGLLRFAGWTFQKKRLRWKDVPETVSHILHMALNQGIDASEVTITQITLLPKCGTTKVEYFVAEFEDKSAGFSAAYVANTNGIVAGFEN